MSNLDEKEYTYLQDGEKHGPFTLEELGEKAIRAEIPFDQFVTPVDGEFAGVPLAALPVPDPVFRQTWERLQQESQERMKEMSEASIPPVVRSGASLAPIALRVLAFMMFLGGLYAIPGPLIFLISAESTEGVLTGIRERYGCAYQYKVGDQTYTGKSYVVPHRPLKARDGGASDPAALYDGRPATAVGDPVVVYYNRHTPAGNRVALPEIGFLLSVFLVATAFLAYSLYQWRQKRRSAA